MYSTSYLYIRNADVIMTSSSYLRIMLPTLSVSMTSASVMLVDNTYSYGAAQFPPMFSSGYGENVTSGFGYGDFPAFVNVGESVPFVPPQTADGFGFFAPFTSSGVGVSIGIGNADSDFPAFASYGGDYNYGLGTGTFPSFTSVGAYGVKGEITLFSLAAGKTASDLVKVAAIVLDSDGQFATTLVGTRIAVAEALSTLTAESALSFIGEFRVSMLSELLGSSHAVGTTGGALPLDPDTKVYVFNIETSATSQYEAFGYNSFFVRDGVSYGVAYDGIYRLDADTDGGNAISWYVDFGESHLGSQARKKILNVHVGTSEGGKTYLRVTTEAGVATYALVECLRGPTGWRAKIPPHVAGMYYRFELISTDVAEVDSVVFEPAKLSRRI